MTYPMARLPMTLSETEGHFCWFKLCNIYNSGNIARFTVVCLHINWKAHMACDLNITVKSEGLLAVRTLEK